MHPEPVRAVRRPLPGPECPAAVSDRRSTLFFGRHIIDDVIPADRLHLQQVQKGGVACADGDEDG